MKFAFWNWKKKEEKKPRVFTINGNDALEVKELLDKTNIAKRVGGGKAERYRLWKLIGELVPETLDDRTDWQTHDNGAFNIDIVEVI